MRGRIDRVLLAILAVSLLLRIYLAQSGGAGFWADESRYSVAVAAVQSLQKGDTAAAIAVILERADHMGFKVAMMLPAWGQLTWHWSFYTVAFLGSGLFSLANVAWIYALSSRMGAGRSEARWATFLMACTTSMFYWSRHLMPYDMALCWGLACLYVGLNPQGRWWDSILAGVFGFMSFVTYNGAWLFAGFALAAHVLRAWPSWWRMIVRAVGGIVGLIGSLVALLTAATYADVYLLTDYTRFAGTVKQGDLSEGHHVLGGYFWNAEHGMVALWLTAMVVLVAAWRRKEAGLGRAWCWFWGIVSLVLIMVICSNVLQSFVVYGRTARMIAPFLALLSGWVIARWVAMPGAASWRGPLAIGLVLVMTAINFARPLGQVYPDKFFRQARLLIDERLKDITDSAERDQAQKKYKLMYASFIWPMPEHYDFTPGEVLLQARNPLQWDPYLFEGFNHEQRDAIHATDVTMRLVQIKD